MKILYVEDDPLDAELIEEELAKSAPHFELTTVSTLKEARARLKEAAPAYDLVLADLRLPDGDGRTLLSHIRQQALPIAVVIITGHSDEETAVTLLKTGADDYLTKHQDYLARLPLTLENALHHRRALAARHERPLRVLYAEHHTLDIDLTRHHLARYAPYIQLDFCHTAPEALQRLINGSADNYDLLLLDFKLPGMNALELLKEIRQVHRLNLPVILVTGRGDEETAVQALRLGVAGYMVKNTGYLYRLPTMLENAFYRHQLVQEQNALRESEARFRIISELTSDYAYAFCVEPDGSQTLEWITEAFAQITGFTPEEAQRWGGWATMIHLDDMPIALQRAERLFAGQSDVSEFRIITKNGDVRWLRDHSRPIWDEGQGRVVSIYGAAQDITGRKQADEALRKSEATTRALLNAIPDLIFRLSGDGINLEVIPTKNIPTLEPPDQLIGKTLYETLPFELAQQREHYIKQALQTGEPQNYEYQLILQGELRHEEARIVATEDNEVLLIIRDITERKQAEEALQASEKLFRTLSRVAPVGIFLNGVEGDCTYINERACEITGLTFEQALNISWESALHPQDRERIQKAWSRTIHENIPFKEEYRFQKPDGSVSWVIGEKLAIESETGELQGYVGALMDITEHRQIEIALQESRRTLSTLLDNLPGMAYRCRNNIDWDMEFVSQGCVELTGYAPEDLMYNPKISYGKIIHPDDQQMVWQEVQSALEQNRQFQLTYRIITATGAEKWVWEQGVGVPLADDEVLLEGFIINVTEREQAEVALKEYSDRLEQIVAERTHKLQQAQVQLVRQEKMATLGQLAAGVAHELRNPLGAVRNAAYFLNMTLDSPDQEVQECLHILEKEINASEQIIRELLDYAQIQPPVRRKIKIAPILKEILSQTKIPEKIEVVQELDNALPAIPVDRSQLKQILNHLIENAVQAMPAGGRLTICTGIEAQKNVATLTAAKEKGWNEGQKTISSASGVAIAIADSGKGIAQENIDKIFEPLFTTKARGIGLGLAFVKALVEGHGGTIKVESKPDRGSTFTVCLPLVADNESSLEVMQT